MNDPASEEVELQAILEAVRHPTRRAILQILREGDTTVSPINASRRLRESLSKVNHHFKRLRKLGIIELVEKRAVRGAQENLYKLKADAIDHPVLHSALFKDNPRDGGLP